MENDKLTNYLMDGCETWEELQQKEYDKAAKLQKKYLYSVENAEEEDKESYRKYADIFTKALESSEYPQAAAVDTVKRNIAQMLGAKPLNQLIHMKNSLDFCWWPGAGSSHKYTEGFVRSFGDVLGSEDELLSMSFEDLREKLYDYVGLECITLEMWQKGNEYIPSLGSTRFHLEDNIKAGIEKYNGVPLATSLGSRAEELLYKVNGIGVNKIADKNRTR